MRSLSLLLLLVGLPACAAAPGAATGPSPREAAEVRAVVDRLFDGMRAGDSTAVRAVFHPSATLLTTARRDGAPVLQSSPVDAFVAAVGAPRDRVWDERIRNVEIRIDGDLATAWMDYAFYAGTELSHCGVNAFQLFRGPEGWRIVHLADTRRREPCVQF
jgi:hypothetical protein